MASLLGGVETLVQGAPYDGDKSTRPCTPEHSAVDYRDLVNQKRPWASEALCAQTNPEAFFPEGGGSTQQVKVICGNCPVRIACLNEALERGERFGIWGGTSWNERKKILRDRGVDPDDD